jgi:hypothetical protein
MSAGRALAIGDLADLRRQSGLPSRMEVRELPTLQDIYLAVLSRSSRGSHDRELADLRSA